MLVLSRLEGQQTILILPDGRQIVHHTVEVRGDKVRHGWTAPPDVVILRREVFERNQTQE